MVCKIEFLKCFQISFSYVVARLGIQYDSKDVRNNAVVFSKELFY